MKHLIINLALICIIIMGMASKAAAGFGAAPKHAGAAVIEGQWKLLPVLASDTETGKIPLIIFNIANRSFTGNTGCNSFNGKIAVNGDKLSFTEQAVVTQNDCQGYNEDAFMASLIKVNHYKIDHGVLELMIDETILSKWVRKEPVNTVKKV